MFFYSRGWEGSVMPPASPCETPPTSLWLPSPKLNKFNPFSGGQIPKHSLLPFLPEYSTVDNPMILQGTDLGFEAPSIWKQPLSLWCLRKRHFCPGGFYSNGNLDTWDLSCHNRKCKQQAIGDLWRTELEREGSGEKESRERKWMGKETPNSQGKNFSE